MLDKIKILVFSGSLRAGSYNKRILKIAGRGAEKALKLQGLLTQYDGFLIATPEYNCSLPVALSGL